MSILGFILYLVVAAVCAWIAEYFVPNGVPGGFLVTAIFGLIGAWVGTSLMGHVGPTLAGVPVLPAIIGSGIVIFLISLVGRGMHRTV